METILLAEEEKVQTGQSRTDTVYTIPLVFDCFPVGPHTLQMIMRVRYSAVGNDIINETLLVLIVWLGKFPI